MTDVKADHHDSTSEVAADAAAHAPAMTFKLRGVKLPRWRTPLAQIILVGFICFLCPGMFNALGGMGGGGQLDTTVNSSSNTALYSTFAVFGFFAGPILNYLGAPLTLAIGGTGYCLYSASFLCYNHTHNRGFVIFAGTFTGFSAALLWCAQGTVMMSYPTESEKGAYIGLFWAIFNMGGVIGSIVPIADLWDLGTQNLVVKDGVYVGFLVLMLVGAFLACFLAPPSKIIRKDGTRVERKRYPSAWAEFAGLWSTLKSDVYIVWLFPFFFASNWFYTYQQNSYNVFFFNTRTKPFNGLWYWFAQIVGALLFGFFLDNKRMSRRSRAIYGLGIVFVVVNAVWGGGLKAERMSRRPPDSDTTGDTFIAMDITSHNYAWYCILYVAYGFLDAIWQTYAYWIMGALSNEPHKLAYFAGFYKGIQSAGGAVAWGLDFHKVSYAGLFGSSWGLCEFGILCAIPIVWSYVKETTYTDATFAEAVKAADELIVAGGELPPSEARELAAAPEAGLAEKST